MRRPGVVLALALLLTACGGDPDPVAAPDRSPSASPTASGSPRPVPALDWSGCGEGFSCATLEVPLAEAEPDRGTVDLAVVRHRAEGPGARIGSLVVNPGGPGASAVGYLRGAYRQVPPAVRARFDLVAVDPRGVGESAPVRCATTAQLDAYFSLDPSPDDAAELAAYERGNAALAKGCQERSGELLPHVSTREAASDLDRLRAALGDERLTYLGYSYGTSIGAQYLERFPTRVRAMVLDGALDPALTWDALLTGQARGFEGAFASFLADCERTRCLFREAVDGDLGAAYDRLAARVERTPLPGAGERTVGPGELTLGVGAALYNRQDGWPALALALAEAEEGDGEVLLSLFDSYTERGEDGYANTSEANLAVNCLDRPWPRETGPYAALAARLADDAPRFGPAIAFAGLSCADWPVPPVSVPERVAAPGAPPVVVIGTTGDPATPYAWSVALADQLRSGVLLTYEGEGHTVYRAGAPSCITTPVNTYLLTGRAPAATRC